MNDGMRDLHHTSEPNQVLVLNLITPEQDPHEAVFGLGGRDNDSVDGESRGTGDAALGAFTQVLINFGFVFFGGQAGIKLFAV